MSCSSIVIYKYAVCLNVRTWKYDCGEWNLQGSETCFTFSSSLRVKNYNSNFSSLKKAEMHTNAVVTCFYIVSFALRILKEKSVSIGGEVRKTAGTWKRLQSLHLPHLLLCWPPQIPQAWAPRLEQTRATPQPKAASLQQLLRSTQWVSKWLFPPLGLARGSRTFSSGMSHTGRSM